MPHFVPSVSRFKGSSRSVNVLESFITLCCVSFCTLGKISVSFLDHEGGFHASSSSTDRWSPGISLKMCLRMLALLPLRGRVPNKEEILVSSQEGDRELLLPARLELLLRPSDWWWFGLLLDENLLVLSSEVKSLEKKQLSSAVLAALKGPGELRSPNTLAWSLSSVITLL